MGLVAKLQQPFPDGEGGDTRRKSNNDDARAAEPAG